MDIAAQAEPPDHFQTPLPTSMETGPWYRIDQCAHDAVYFNQSALF